MKPHTWRKLIRPGFGVAVSVSDAVGGGVDQHPLVLEQLRRADSLLLFSDIGGDHRGATHRAHSFLVLDPASLHRWLPLWGSLRHRLLPDGRRMSYERLGDRRRRVALDHFLTASTELVGFLVTVLVEKKLSLFSSEEPIPSEFAHWKPRAFERLLTAVNVASILLGGLTRSGQDVVSFSDEDDLAANDQRLWEVCDVFSRVSSHYLDHGLGHFRFATSKSDDGSRQMEDLLAFPDLAAGWLSELLGSYSRAGAALSEAVILPPPESLPAKSKHLLAWAAASSSNLRHVAVTVDPNGPRSRFLVRRLAFSAAGR